MHPFLCTWKRFRPKRTTTLHSCNQSICLFPLFPFLTAPFLFLKKVFSFTWTANLQQTAQLVCMGVNSCGMLLCLWLQSGSLQMAPRWTLLMMHISHLTATNSPDRHFLISPRPPCVCGGGVGGWRRGSQSCLRLGSDNDCKWWFSHPALTVCYQDHTGF